MTLYELLDAAKHARVIVNTNDSGWLMPVRSIEYHSSEPERWKLNCQGPGYEYHMIVDKSAILYILRRHKPITFHVN